MKKKTAHERNWVETGKIPTNLCYLETGAGSMKRTTKTRRASLVQTFPPPLLTAIARLIERFSSNASKMQS